MRVWQVIEVIVAVLKCSTQRSRCPPLTANALLYIAELCTSVKLHVIPLLPVFMPTVIQVTADLSLLTRFAIISFYFIPVPSNRHHLSFCTSDSLATHGTI